MPKRLRRRPLPVLRYVWLRYVVRYNSEFCFDCGRPYRLVWWADPPLWVECCPEWGVGGLLCPSCFTVRARAVGRLVTWHPHVEWIADSVERWKRAENHIDYEQWEDREGFQKEAANDRR
jgi:hypothetical protein